jgi:hypothetical protein
VFHARSLDFNVFSEILNASQRTFENEFAAIVAMDGIDMPQTG